MEAQLDVETDSRSYQRNATDTVRSGAATVGVDKKDSKLLKSSFDIVPAILLKAINTFCASQALS